MSNPRFTADGIPFDWTVEDWKDWNDTVQAFRDRVRARHAEAFAASKKPGLAKAARGGVVHTAGPVGEPVESRVGEGPRVDVPSNAERPAI